MSARSLLSVEADAKTSKGTSRGYLTGILYLAPSDVAGRGNLCPHASAGCRAACLFTAGRGTFASVHGARVAKTHAFFDDSPAFVDRLAEDIAALVRQADRRGLTPAVRLNGTSDIPWERVKGTDGRTLMERFPSVQFYDYTKRPNRPSVFANYHLTFSRSEHNEQQCLRELASGRNVAAVFETVPETWNGYPVVNGDASDLRFLDAGPCVIGLTAKGRAKREQSGFVVRHRAALQ